MGTWYSPKPLRPVSKNPLFKTQEAATVVKGLSPLQRQRLEDGTPMTRTAKSDLKPADPVLFISNDLTKGSLVEKYAKRPEPPKTDPQDPVGVIKSYLEKETKEKDHLIEKSSVLLGKMQKSIANVLEKVGIEKAADSDEDEEKALNSQGAGQATVGMAAAPVKTALSTGMHR